MQEIWKRVKATRIIWLAGISHSGGESQVVISYEMCIFNRALEGLKEPEHVCTSQKAGGRRGKRQHNTKGRGCLIKVKLKRW